MIGSETCRKFDAKGFDLAGIDNDIRSRFFGPEASTAGARRQLQATLKNYRHEDLDIRDTDRVEALFGRLGPAVKVVIHTAAQPSHDWAARDKHTDFQVNAVGALNLIEAARRHCTEAVFIFTSTNKVYGNTPTACRWWGWNPATKSIAHTHYHVGIDETMSTEQTNHSLFWDEQACCRPTGPRVWSLFRYEDCLFSAGNGRCVRRLTMDATHSPAGLTN